MEEYAKILVEHAAKNAQIVCELVQTWGVMIFAGIVLNTLLLAAILGCLLKARGKTSQNHNP